MYYNEIAGIKVSALGMGNMRLPTTEERGPIDREKAREIIEYAYEHGINFLIPHSVITTANPRALWARCSVSIRGKVLCSYQNSPAT